MLLTWSSLAGAATLTVGPGLDYDSLAEAIAASQPGDQIDVAAGSFIGTAQIRHRLTIRGASREKTVLVAPINPQGAWVDVETAELVTLRDLTLVGDNSSRILEGTNVSLMLDGVTLQGGFSFPSGGQIWVDQATLTLQQVVFEGGEGAFAGGQIFARDTTLTATNCQFSGGTSDRQGGSVRLENATATFASSTFSDHRSGSGGAISSSGDSSHVLTIDACLFQGNTAVGGGGPSYGGAIYQSGGRLVIRGERVSEQSRRRLWRRNLSYCS